MPDYSRPFFADPFLGAFGDERTGSLASELPPADQHGPLEAAVPEQNQLLKILVIIVVAAAVYYLLKEMTKDDPALTSEASPKLDG